MQNFAVVQSGELQTLLTPIITATEDATLCPDAAQMGAMANCVRFATQVAYDYPAVYDRLPPQQFRSILTEWREAGAEWEQLAGLMVAIDDYSRRRIALYE
jgi:hypothetical protein